MARIDGYQGNPNLPREDYIHSYTQWERDEFIKCANDPVYFARNYIKIVNVDRGLMPFEMWDFQEDMMNTFHDNRFSICKLPRQVGKALPLDEEILTPLGFRKFGDLKLGDKVYGPDGKETKVTFITPIMYEHKCYRISFDDGSSVVADADHLWEVDSTWWSKKKVKNTKELLKQLEKTKSGGAGLFIHMNNPIEYDHKDLDIDPYTLGVWLGDGNKSDARVTCHKDDLNNYVNNIPYVLKTIRSDYRNQNVQRFTIEGLHSKLRGAGLLFNKHIPERYMTSSIDQRLELIRGLMDTDGSIRKNGGLEFYQKNEQFIDDVALILRSIGIKVRKDFKVIKEQKYFCLRFASTKFMLFKLKRKLNIQLNHKYYPKNDRLYIKDIVEVDSVPVRCIQVDNKDHLFLIGTNLIPTHNTTTAVAYLLHYLLFNSGVSVAILANKAPTAREIMGRLQLAFEYLPRFLQQGVREWNKGNVELANGSKAQADSTSGSSVRGRTFNIIFLDEFAFVPNNIALAFFSSTYPTISSGNSTKVIIVSTPNGLNLFYKMWTDAVEKRSNYIPIEIHWSMVPGRDEAWKEQIIRNTSPDQFRQEFECVTGDTLVEVRDTTTGIEEKITIKELYNKLVKV